MAISENIVAPVRKRFDAAALADIITNAIGSWNFIIAQSILMVIWFILNTAGWFVWHWDPYPFVFLNLFMSMEAAYATPIILMSGNRQQVRDEAKRDADSETLRRIEQIERTLDAHVNGTAKEHSQQLQDLRLILQELHTQLCPDSTLNLTPATPPLPSNLAPVKRTNELLRSGNTPQQRKKASRR